MKLAKRASYLILPVILGSYMIIASGIYNIQKNSLSHLEQNALSHRLAELSSRFSSYKSLTKSYVFTLIQSDELRLFLQESNDQYRAIALGRNLQAAQKQLSHHPSKFMSLAIIDNKGQIQHYFENSQDPFAKIRPKLLKLGFSLHSEGKLNRWDHVRDSGNGTLIVYSGLIDTRTFSPPIKTQLSHSVTVQIAIEPTLFDQLAKQLEEKYSAQIFYSAKPSTAADDLIGTVALGKGEFANLIPSPKYFDRKLYSLQSWLIISLLLMSGLSVGILVWLVRRFITRPISKLEIELAEVLTEKRTNIPLLHTDDEIGSLATSFHYLYKQLSESYITARQQAQTDFLTKVSNRRHFHHLGTTAMDTAKIKQQPLVLLYISLDHFKHVNDIYGHEVGDLLLQAVALRLAKVIRFDSRVELDEAPILARLGGDEFSVIIQHVDDCKATVHIADRILDIFKDGFKFEKGGFPITASIGITVYPQDGQTLTQLLSNSETAMYLAKSSGKNQLAFYSQDLASKARRARAIEHQLRILDCDQEFHLVFMPICRSDSQEIIGCEVLLRWESPVLSFVGPDEFIPIAEVTGLFTKIDYWVIDQALKNYKNLSAVFGENFTLSINLSAAELGTFDISTYIKERTTHHLVPPDRIELEITETFNIDTDYRVDEILTSLRDTGFNIAIDDFGTGFTSLLQMVEYPIDKIKLDKIFIDRVMASDKSQLLPPLIDLCHSQGMTVTAEGVETAKQAAYLNQAGCDFLQGYFIGKPMPLDQLLSWYEDRILSKNK